MLRELLAITGEPGLFRIVSHGKNNLVVENVTTKKRFAVSARSKVVSLGDIAMYTDSEDKPLGEILDLVYEKNKGEKIDVKSLAKDGKLKEEFALILPDFDRERVYDNDIKKLFNWYNILVEDGMKKFTEEKEPVKEEETPEEEKKEGISDKKEKGTATDKKSE